MKTYNQILQLILVCFLGGCSTASFKVDYDKSTDFSTLKTYSWGDSAIQLKESANTSDLVIERVASMVRDDIQPIVDEELAGKGYTLIKNGKADMVIQYSALGDVTNDNRRSNYAPGRVGVQNPSEKSGAMMLGTITLNVKQKDSSKVIWHGEVEAIITGDGTDNTRLKKIITTLIEDFPPER